MYGLVIGACSFVPFGELFLVYKFLLCHMRHASMRKLLITEIDLHRTVCRNMSKKQNYRGLKIRAPNYIFMS